MIKRILSIDNFGVFDDFKWSRDATLQDFVEKNIIYGWNYSGKTTLSRLFCSLRDNEIHQDYRNAKFKLQLYDNREIDVNAINEFGNRVFVFNKEYIESKLTWNSNAKLGEPIAFDVGENVEIREEIERLSQKIEKAKGRKLSHQAAIDRFNEFDNKLFTEHSKTIRLIIANNTIPFDKGHLKIIIESLSREKVYEHIISDDAKIEELKNIATSTNDFLKIDPIGFYPEYLNLKSSVSEVLQKEPPKDVVIDILDKNSKLFDWVHNGLEFEENKNKCSFCGNIISESRFVELRNYFSNASKEVRDEISNLIAQINAEKDKTNALETPKSKNDFTEKIRGNIQKQIDSYNSIKIKYLSALDILSKELNRKLDGNIFNKLELTSINDNQQSLINWLKETNDLIEGHNSLIENFNAERDSARDLLKYHLVADFLINQNFYEKKATAKKSLKWQALYDQYVSSQEQKKNEKVDSLKTITKGKDHLNKFIRRFLNRDDIEITVTNEDKFQLLRNGYAARNLSEGEKTAIAFSYFLVEYESLGIEEICKTIVFIDDPISSLDTNHIAQVYSLINSFFFRNNVDPTNPDKVVNCFNQLFISTHNFEFFSFLRDSYHLTKKKKIVGEDGKTKEVENCRLYQIQQIATNKSVLKALPKSLRNYKTEYIYLFSLIYDYYERIQSGGDIYDILIPNALRRFLEIYTLMKIPNEPGSVEKRISQLVDDVNNFKTLNHFSHFTTFEKATKHDELLMVLPQACKELMKLLKEDNKHYASLKKSIGK